MRMHVLCGVVSIVFTLGCATGGVSSTPRVLPAAAESYGPMRGESQLSVAGALSKQSVKTDFGDFDSTTLYTLLGVGYFLTDEHEVGGTVNGFVVRPDEGDDAVSVGIQPYYNYNYRQSSRTWFYFGPHLGLQKVDVGGESDSSFSMGVHVGAKMWLSPTTAFYVEPRYTTYDTGDFDIDETQVLFGLSWILR